MKLIVPASLVAVLLSAVLGAQDAAVNAAADRVAPAIIELRHQIHQNPELGNREAKTAALVADHLRKLGFDTFHPD